MNAEDIAAFGSLTIAEIEALAAGWSVEQMCRLRYLKLLVERGQIQESVVDRWD